MLHLFKLGIWGSSWGRGLRSYTYRMQLRYILNRWTICCVHARARSAGATARAPAEGHTLVLQSSEAQRQRGDPPPRLGG